MGLNTRSATERALDPDSRTTANPASPIGVEMATMVSLRNIFSGGKIRVDFLLHDPATTAALFRNFFCAYNASVMHHSSVEAGPSVDQAAKTSAINPVSDQPLLSSAPSRPDRSVRLKSPFQSVSWVG